MAAKAEPDVIEIGYGENVTIEVGMMDLTNGEWDTRGLLFYMNARFLNFEVVEYPGGNLDRSWFVSFNPPSIQAEPDVVKPMKTNVTISLTAPQDPSKTIQSGILKIKIKDITAFGNLWWPENDSLNFGDKLLWFSGAAFTFRYGKWSGTVDTEQERNIAILVKVKPYHKMRFEAAPVKQITPGEIESIPIHLQNLGNYNDTFGFRIAGEHERIELSNPVSISLKPGEEQDTYLAVAVTPNILDTGTLNTIKIEAYSIDQPNITIAQDTVFLETKGVYISELGGIGFALLGSIVLIIIAIFIYWRRKILKKSGNKPEKIWQTPEKKQYLENLKQKDPEKYSMELNEMKNDYKTAMISYETSRITTLQESRKKFMKKFMDIFKRPEKEKKVQPKTTKKKKQSISEKLKIEKLKNRIVQPKFLKKEIEKKPLDDRILPSEEQQRESAIMKIKRAQEKQRKKIEKLIIE